MPGLAGRSVTASPVAPRLCWPPPHLLCPLAGQNFHPSPPTLCFTLPVRLWPHHSMVITSVGSLVTSQPWVPLSPLLSGAPTVALSYPVCSGFTAWCSDPSFRAASSPVSYFAPWPTILPTMVLPFFRSLSWCVPFFFFSKPQFTVRNSFCGIPGWCSALAPAFGPGHDPGDPGSNPTSGSRCMEPASPSACVSASLSV